MLAGTLGVFAGWLIVMPATVLTLALRADELSAQSGSTQYSLILGAGWVTLILALTIMGRFSDLQQRKRNSRRRAVVFGIVGSMALGFALSQASSIALLATSWCALQIPAAAIITSSLAIASSQSSSNQKGLVSGITGGAPVLALFVGTLFAKSLDVSTASIFLVTSILGAACAIPLLARPKTPGKPNETMSLKELPNSATTASTKFWRNFLIAAFLVSCTTASANGYLLIYTTDVVKLSSDDASQLVTTMVLIASSASLIAGLISGRLAYEHKSATRTYAVAAAAVGLSIALLILFPSTHTILFAGLIFGAGFGAANGLELTMYMNSFDDHTSAGDVLGRFSSVTTAPYVMVPLIAAVLLRDDDPIGINILWTGGALCALVAAVLMVHSLRKHSLA